MKEQPSSGYWFTISYLVGLDGCGVGAGLGFGVGDLVGPVDGIGDGFGDEGVVMMVSSNRC